MSDDNLVAFIAEHSVHDRASIYTVLAVELEYFRAVGVAWPPPAQWHFYTEHNPPTFPRRAQSGSLEVESDVIAADVDRFTGIPSHVANEIMLLEIDYVNRFGDTSEGPRQ
jgi:hypothetical protein